VSQICKSCYYKNLDIAIYCAKCANKLKVKTTDKNKNSSSNSEKEKNIDTKLIRQIQIGISSVIAFIVILFIIFNYLGKAKNQSDYTIGEDIKSIQIEEELELEEEKNRIESPPIESIEPSIVKVSKNNIWECDIQWIIDNGKKIKPTNENLQILSIELINKMDRLHLKTQNGESKYNYSSFIGLDDDNLGMEYIYGNRFIGIFQDGTLLLGDRKSGVDANYYCKDMILDIKKFTFHKTKKIIETEIIPITPSKIPKVTISVEKFSIPSNAKVRILNIKPKYYDGIKLKKGKYHLEISKNGYRTINKWITLKQNENFNFELKKIKKYISPKVIQDEHVISPDSYTSSKVIKYEEPVNNYSVPKRMNKKERENLRRCLAGNMISICKHSWLTPQQAIEVKRAERREEN